MVTVRLRQALILASILASGASNTRAAEVPARVPDRTNVEIRLAEGERCFVLAKDFSAVTTYPTSFDGTPGLVFTGKPGPYAVLAWTDSGQSQSVVWIGAEDPKPEPDEPDGPDEPDTPAVVPNKYGLGQSAFDEAVALGDPTSAAKLASIWLDGASQMAALGGDLIDDASLVNTAIKDATVAALGAVKANSWLAWRNKRGQDLTAAWFSQKVSTRDKYVEALAEVGTALKLAGGKK